MRSKPEGRQAASVEPVKMSWITWLRSGLKRINQDYPRLLLPINYSDLDRQYFFKDRERKILDRNDCAGAKKKPNRTTNPNICDALVSIALEN
jgi:hypothetical protein